MNSGQAWGETPTDYRFTGQAEHSSIGLYYYNARWYDAYLNRWIQPDTIVPQPENPQSLNRFSYVYNNPLKYSDPTGHCPSNEIPCPPEREQDITSWPGLARSLAVAGCGLAGGCRVRHKADGTIVIRSGGVELCAEAIESQAAGLASPVAGPVVGLVSKPAQLVSRFASNKVVGGVARVVGKFKHFELSRFLKGWHVHHLVEKRFWKQLGFSSLEEGRDEILSALLPPDFHIDDITRQLERKIK
jgi:RHS repeat-associated protein